jgi:hypothetical protein
MKDLVFIEEEYNSELHHHADKYMELILDIYTQKMCFELSIIRCEFRLISRFCYISCF